MPLGMVGVLCEGCKWFKPPKLSSRECQCYLQMFLLIKANKIKAFSYFQTNQPALWFISIPSFTNSIWQQQGLQVQQLLRHLWTKVSLTCLRSSLSSSVEKKCKYLCWKQKDETADPLLAILLYKKMRESSSSPHTVPDCGEQRSLALPCPGAAGCTLRFPLLPLCSAGIPLFFPALPGAYQCWSVSGQEGGLTSHI